MDPGPPSHRIGGMEPRRLRDKVSRHKSSLIDHKDCTRVESETPFPHPVCIPPVVVLLPPAYRDRCRTPLRAVIDDVSPDPVSSFLTILPPHSQETWVSPSRPPQPKLVDSFRSSRRTVHPLPSHQYSTHNPTPSYLIQDIA